MTTGAPEAYAAGVGSPAEPVLARPPSRTVAWRDAGLAAVLGAVMVGGTAGAQRHLQNFQPPVHSLDAGGILLLLGIAGVLALRRRQPVAVLWAISALTLGYFLVGYPPGPVWLGLLVAYPTAVVRGHRLGAGVAAGVCFLVFPWLADLLGRGPAPTPLYLSVLAAGLLGLFAAAEALRARRVRAAETARRRAEEVAAAATEERMRIARDLHDVLAHTISLINVQAGVALHLNDDLPDQARSALTAIKQASREALGELRSALDALRQSGDAAPRAPAPGLGQLDDLVASARAAGLETSVAVTGPPAPLPAPVDQAAFRIVQEALTNVIRHAGASAVAISVDYGAGALTLRVDDDGQAAGGAAGVAAASSGDGSRGSGIIGMRERAQSLGGTLMAAPRPSGGFSVVALLPLPAGTEPPAAEPQDGALSGAGAALLEPPAGERPAAALAGERPAAALAGDRQPAALAGDRQPAALAGERPAAPTGERP
jgi:signal transduction histidine kinase